MDFYDFEVYDDDQFMPTWRPLTPPLSDMDEELYSNGLSSLLYEEYLMDDNDLPATEHDLPLPLSKYSHSPPKKQKESPSSNSTAILDLLNAASPIVTAEHAAAEANKNAANLYQSQQGSSLGVSSAVPLESPSVRRSSSSNRKSIKSTYEPLTGRTTKGDLRRPTTPPPADREAKDYEGPEWTILEDYALLQAVLSEQRLTHMSPTEKSGIKLNWEFISGFVNRVTGNYRSPRQCSMHYQRAVLPREDGRFVTICPVTKKPRKVNPSPAEITHLRKGRKTTYQQYENDVETVLRDKLLERMRTMKAVRDGRLPTFVRVNPNEVPSTGAPPDNHLQRMAQWEMDPSNQFEAIDSTLAKREEKRTMMMMQEKEARMGHDAKLAEEREKAVSCSSFSITVRPSAIAHQTGILITPPLIQLEVPPPPRVHASLGTQGHSGALGALQGGGVPSSVAGGMMGLPVSVAQQQPLPVPIINPLSTQSNAMADMPPVGGMSRRVGSSQMMGSGGGSQSHYAVVGGEGQQSGQQGMGGQGGSVGQSQQVAGRMGGVSGAGPTGGSSQPMYRTAPPKRPAPGSIPRMSGYMGEGGSPSQVQVARGQSVGRTDTRPFNARVAQRVLPGGPTNRVYAPQGGSGSGSASPSYGGQPMGGEGGPQSAQGRSNMYMIPQQQHAMRVGIQPPPRMSGAMGGSGGGAGGGSGPKRAHSIVTPKSQPGMMMARPAGGGGMNQMRGPQQISRFSSGSNTAPVRMNVVVRDGVSHTGGQGMMRGGMTASPSGMSPMGSLPPSSLQPRSMLPSRSMSNPRSQSQLPVSTLHLPNDGASSSGVATDPLPPQGGPLPSISLSSSSSSFPNPSSHHSM